MMATVSMADAILSLTAALPDRFIGQSGDANHAGSVFGGQMIAQSLVAALRTVDTLPLSSMHAYFLAPATVSAPLEYRVDRLRDSRRFANRQVFVHQGGKRVLVLACQFHAPEEGFEHQAVAMPDVPPPEEVKSLQAFVQQNAGLLDVAAIRNFSGALPVELRPIDPAAYFLDRPERPLRDFWFRLPSASAIDDPRLQQCLLAYASDYWLAGVPAVPHAFPTNGRHLLLSSLDHAVWFHRLVRCDDWLLHHTMSPSARDGLGLAQGFIFDRSGGLVATTMQESLVRRLHPPEAADDGPAKLHGSSSSDRPIL